MIGCRSTTVGFGRPGVDLWLGAICLVSDVATLVGGWFIVFPCHVVVCGALRLDSDVNFGCHVGSCWTHMCLQIELIIPGLISFNQNLLTGSVILALGLAACIIHFDTVNRTGSGRWTSWVTCDSILGDWTILCGS